MKNLWLGLFFLAETVSAVSLQEISDRCVVFKAVTGDFRAEEVSFLEVNLYNVQDYMQKVVLTQTEKTRFNVLLPIYTELRKAEDPLIYAFSTGKFADNLVGTEIYLAFLENYSTTRIKGNEGPAMGIKDEASKVAVQLKNIPLDSPYYAEAQSQVELFNELANERMYKNFIIRAEEILQNSQKEIAEPKRKDSLKLTPELISAIFPMQYDEFKRAAIGSPERIFSELSIQGFGAYLNDTEVGRIDISFSNIKAFALRKLKKVQSRPITKYGYCTLENLKWALDKFDPRRMNDIYELGAICLGSIFEIPTSSSKSRVIGNPREIAQQKINILAKTPLGYKKLLTLLTLFALGSNGIRLVQTRNLSLVFQKIKLIIVDQYARDFTSFCQFSSSGEISVFFSKDAVDSTWFHELSHAGHALIAVPFVSNMNKGMMHAVVHTSENTPRYWEALFPMIASRGSVVPMIEKALPRNKVASFVRSRFFADMIQTIRDGGLTPQYSPENIRSIADIIFFYTCCFCDGKQVWDNPEEVVTIYGRCPFEFEASGKRVIVELIDEENQSNFEKRTILYHEGQIVQLYNRSLDKVFREMSVNGITLPIDAAFHSPYSDVLRNFDNHPQLSQRIADKYGLKGKDYGKIVEEILNANEE